MVDLQLLETAPAVARAAAELAEEHRAIDAQAGRLRGASGLEEFVLALHELSRSLQAHFAHEEQPNGLYDALGVCVPQHRERLSELVDDHYRIAAAARSLEERSRFLRERLNALREEAAGLVSFLERHERRERALVREAGGRR
jgi:hypothetical protein